MATFDETLERFLADPTRGALPGVDDPSIDSVAWHDFAQYELLLAPLEYEPPPVGGTEEGEHVDPDLPNTDYDPEFDPGPGPWAGGFVQGLVRQLDDPNIATPALQQFLQTVSRTVNHVIRRHFGLGRRDRFPELACRLKSAFETALVQGGHLSGLYDSYVSIPPHHDRDALFTAPAAHWTPGGGALADLVRAAWRYGSAIPPSVFREVSGLAAAIHRGIAHARCARSPARGRASASSQLFQTSSSTLPSPKYDFSVFAPQSTNLGLRLVYRQEWRLLGVQRGEVVRTLPLGPRQTEKVSTRVVRRTRTQRTVESVRAVESTTEVTDTSKDSTDVVQETTETSGWKVEGGGSVGVSGMGVEASGSMNEEVSAKVGTTNSFLLESVQKTANKIRMESKVQVSTEGETTFESTSASEIQNPNDEIPVTYVYSKLQRQYEVFTHLNEVNTVVFVAERVPTESELKQWIKDHDWIIARVLLDDSFRDALSALNQDVPQPAIEDPFVALFTDAMGHMTAADGTLDILAANTSSLSLQQADLTQEIQRSVQQVRKERDERDRSIALHEQKTLRLLEHVRRNLLHYCRAVWSQEDADQRMLRYRRAGIEVPTAWEFVVADAAVELATLAADPSLLMDGTFRPVAGSERPVADVINPAGPIGYHGNYAVYYVQPDLRLTEANVFEVLDLVRQPYVDDGDPPGYLDPAREYIESTATVPRPIPPGTKEDMLRLVPALRALYEAESDVPVNDGDPSPREQFFADDANFTDAHYFEFLFRRQFTRQLVLDTNNVMVDIEAGTGSTLEGFKRLHRLVDVMKAVEERNKATLENARLEHRLDAGELDDPDIENMTVVTAEMHDHHGHHGPPDHAQAGGVALGVEEGGDDE